VGDKSASTGARAAQQEPPGTGVAITPAPIATGRADVVPRASVPATPTTDTTGRVAAPPVERAAPAARPDASPSVAAPAATRDTARRLGREFVTMLNQGRYRDLQAIPQVGGDAAARADLIRLVQTASGFSAGFDRLPSAPGEWASGFVTEFDLDLEWSGGKKLVRVQLFASPASGGWHVAGIAVSPAG
jgi:hypothetical protein